MTHRVVECLCGVSAALLATGCVHPRVDDMVVYLRADSEYAQVAFGAARVDAIFRRARAMAGSDSEALQLLGSLAVSEGLKLRHPFDTGLTASGPLSRRDRTGHFFSQAMWRYNDRRRHSRVAELNGFLWEVVGELKSWVSSGDGFDWFDIWANRLGREFGDRIYDGRHDPDSAILPSEVIRLADEFRPKRAVSGRR